MTNKFNLICTIIKLFVYECSKIIMLRKINYIIFVADVHDIIGEKKKCRRMEISTRQVTRQDKTAEDEVV